MTTHKQMYPVHPRHQLFIEAFQQLRKLSLYLFRKLKAIYHNVKKP